MFPIFASAADWWLPVLLLILLLGPVASFLTAAWRFRKEEIVDGLSTSAVKRYLETFYHLRDNDPRGTFTSLYVHRFGRRRYAMAIAMLGAAGATAAVWMTASVLTWTGLHPASIPGLLDPVSVAALAGAYIWVVGEIITRWRFRDISPADLWSASWRLMLAVPLALAIGGLFAKELAIPIAFLLGAFPTRSVTTIARRFARRTMNLGADSDERAESELEKLQGIDTRTAERLADEGITTIVQLAYFDPVELTMRCASFSFSFIVDVISQALAHLYVSDDLAKLRPLSLRGAQEIASLITELDEGNDHEKAMANATIAAAATHLGMEATVVERTFREIAEDPFTEFLLEVWATSD
ncbi:MAG: hypothetical protein ACJ74H_20430 [Thermoanaerobaculia bacterium]